LYRDFVSGKRDPKEYGLTAKDVEKPGAKLPKLLIEYTTKFERIDRPLTREEARGLMELTKSKLDELESILKRAVYASNSIYELAGYISADGKLEFALCFDNTLMIVDYFGNPDENRLVKISKNGRVMHFSKEFLRQYLIEIGFKKLVDEARALGAPDPAYPDVPDAIVKEASRRYTTVANAYTRIPA
jgi:phosphoribosylaminoimidazole-succinocarboxamide synthase